MQVKCEAAFATERLAGRELRGKRNDALNGRWLTDLYHFRNRNSNFRYKESTVVCTTYFSVVNFSGLKMQIVRSEFYRLRKQPSASDDSGESSPQNCNDLCDFHSFDNIILQGGLINLVVHIIDRP